MTDAVILGAGPAGAAAALALRSRGARVTLVDPVVTPAWRIGESLPGAARRVLTALGAWERFAHAGHAPAPVKVSRWGSPDPVTLDAFRDPDGVGWQLDRAQFESDLRLDATERGAQLVAPARAAHLSREGGHWQVQLDTGVTLKAEVVVDATGRHSRLLRPFGQQQAVQDRLACVYQRVPVGGPRDPATYTEADRDGWWYSAALPDGARLIAFHGDADQQALRDMYRAGPLAAARALPGLAEVLADARSTPSAPAACAANTLARSAAGPGWFAAGDSVTALDPLSSQGLLNALITGLEAGSAAAEWLGGAERAAAEYAGRVGQIWQAYAQHHAVYYGLERRWPEAPFWQRRQVRAHPAGH
ncbi:tryptophan 7-halogenase [Deinococcus radiotolerans]|uniref:Uncharacterized protein n=1 Tax=Deinococcus radiotolerans TaxID=1309407 RepID=A0ABQ2FK06_9DEIO|nr:tryptophan 7-halogenase [Deinococcus radiotolerans]GGL00321.1 hypothetical protein GCM10010844_18440 [Deinococcus radiotolerans]